MLPLKLFVSFYTPSDPSRRKEVYDCLTNNAKSGLFRDIILLIDDGISPLSISNKDHGNTHISLVHMPERPCYSDWIYLTSIDPESDFISVLSNSDIDFSNASIENFNQAINEATFLCLSRHEINKSDSALLPHPNPHWTQDTWAIRAEDTAKICGGHLKDLSMPLGYLDVMVKLPLVFTQGAGI